MKVERVQMDVVCDRPGCGKRVTDKGGAMYTIEHRVRFAKVDGEAGAHVDLCRECYGQMQAAWSRKGEEA